MIIVTRLDHTRFAVNPDLIERVHEAPDTTLHVVGGRVYVVKESLPALVDLIIDYRARVLVAAQTLAQRPEA